MQFCILHSDHHAQACYSPLLIRLHKKAQSVCSHAVPFDHFCAQLCLTVVCFVYALNVTFACYVHMYVCMYMYICSQYVYTLFDDGCLLCRVEQQRFQSEMDKLQHALEAKEAQMQRVVNGTGQVSALKQHYDRVLMDLAGERDVLQADRTRLLQVSSGSACRQLFIDICVTLVSLLR